MPIDFSRNGHPVDFGGATLDERYELAGKEALNRKGVNVEIGRWSDDDADHSQCRKHHDRQRQFLHAWFTEQIGAAKLTLQVGTRGKVEGGVAYRVAYARVNGKRAAA